jgi:hypothetical protein
MEVLVVSFGTHFTKAFDSMYKCTHRRDKKKVTKAKSRFYKDVIYLF